MTVDFHCQSDWLSKPRTSEIHTLLMSRGTLVEDELRGSLPQMWMSPSGELRS